MLVELYVLVGLAVLTLLAGLAIRWRFLRRTGRVGSILSDDDVEQILATGTLKVEDDPLDLDEVREAEERFWSETWDEAEEV
ncbi:MAG: hypothetical protein HKN73_01955 [Gemmatimonadetes bacterium]|nr:hypothetical protein [Gemmatimonadota bacterium]